MATIYFLSLDPKIQMAVRNRQYDEEEILRLNEKIKADEKVKKKTFIVTMIIVTSLLLVGGIIIYGSEIGFPEALPLLLLNMLAAAIVGAVSWYAAIGRMSKQWDDLMRSYYPSVYMDNEYGSTDQSANGPKRTEPVTKTKPEINKASVLKKAYHITTIILSVLIMVFFVIVGISAIGSRRAADDTAGAFVSILIAGMAAGSLILSVKGMRQNCYIPGTILEKAGVLSIGAGLIVVVTGIISQSKMIEILALAVPAFIIGAVCFSFGIKMINRKRELSQEESGQV